MVATLLARIQFGFAAGFHFLFPPLTMGLALVVLALETVRLRRPDSPAGPVSAFLVRVLALVFVCGAATGITLEFAFGANWSAFSRAVGDVFGAPLAAEGLFGFFLESIFLGILVFGRGKARRGLYWFSALAVFLAAHLSAFLIVAANSWMQTPAGFAWRGGRAVLDGLSAAVFNPSTGVRFVHVALAAWMTGGLAAAALAGGWLRRGRNPRGARLLLGLSFGVFAAASIAQLASGHAHAVEVARWQPAKLAAYEGVWTTGPAALTLFGIPDESAGVTRAAVRVPRMLSWLTAFDPNATVSGLDAFPRGERPPVLPVFVAYHLMFLAGLTLIAIAAFGLLLAAKRRLAGSRRFLRLLAFAVPLPVAANLFGWAAAEIGRQPWTVQDLLRTADAVSPVVGAGSVAFSLSVLALLYALIAVAAGVLLARLVRGGPAAEAAAAAEPGVGSPGPAPVVASAVGGGAR